MVHDMVGFAIGRLGLTFRICSAAFITMKRILVNEPLLDGLGHKETMRKWRKSWSWTMRLFCAPC